MGAGIVVPGAQPGYGAGQLMSQTTGKTSESQVSPRGVQSTHDAPSDPHSVDTVPAWQLFMLSQQPEQVSLQGQAAPPRIPNPVWQLPLPSQHPCGQVVGPHTNPPHVPCRQNPAFGQLAHWFPSNPHSAFVVPG
jgi:hypothetical protein